MSRRFLTRRQRLARTATATAALLLCAAVATVLLGGQNPSALPTQHVSALASQHPAAIVPVTALDPVQFSTGSCVALAPTKGNRHLTVFLDAGHGGPDPGGRDKGGEAVRACLALIELKHRFLGNER